MEVKAGCKRTDAGVIPEEWEICKLGNLINYTKGYAFRSDEYVSDGVRVVRVSDTSYDKILDDTPVFVSESKAQQYAKWRLKTDDLVISTVGSKPPMYNSMVGKVVLISQRNHGALLNQNAVLLRDKKKRRHVQQILLNHFRSKRYLRWIESIYRGNANQASITLKELFEFPIPLPVTDAEQRPIATALGDVDALLSELDRLIAKKRDLKQAAMQQLLTGKTRLPGFHGAWEMKSVGEIASVFKGTQLDSSETSPDGHFPHYNGGISPSNYTDKSNTPINTIAISEGGNSCGYVQLVPERFWCGGHCYAVAPKGINNGFLYHALKGKQAAIMGLRVGSGLPNIQKTALLAFKLDVASDPTEQTAIAEVLSDMDAELRALEQRAGEDPRPQAGYDARVIDRQNQTRMNAIGKAERVTQNRVIGLFRDELKYRYLGDWSDRPGNSNIDEGLLKEYLAKCLYSPEQISRAIYLLNTEAKNPTRSLYENNKAVYSLLRYGVPVKIEAGKVTDTVKLINWSEPEKNDFAVAKEVTLGGNYERRPDLVLYINGIAVAVIELKNSYVSIGNGIRQLLSNQQREFHEWFFSTVQIVFAGNDSEGLRYGTIGTPEKYFLKWKEDEADNTRFKLDKYLLKMCRKERLIELLHDFVLFDGGVKKLPRVHQYVGIKEAQKRVNAYQGGIIWHTQGSGKSIVMVLLAKWILENKPNARVVILTDRDELDKQIERVFTGTGEAIYRTSSGHDLMVQLGQAKPRLLCSLIHKFGKKEVGDFDAFIEELKKQPSPAVGELFIFVDECHRTQSGKLHKTMKALLAGRGIYRLHRHAPPQAGQADQPRSVRHLHPHLQVRRGG